MQYEEEDFLTRKEEIIWGCIAAIVSIASLAVAGWQVLTTEGSVFDLAWGMWVLIAIPIICSLGAGWLAWNLFRS